MLIFMNGCNAKSCTYFHNGFGRGNHGNVVITSFHEKSSWSAVDGQMNFVHRMIKDRGMRWLQPYITC